MSKSSPCALAESTISAFFIFFTEDNVGISSFSIGVGFALLLSLDVLEPPNSLAKKPFFLLSLLSLIIFA